MKKKTIMEGILDAAAKLPLENTIIENDMKIDNIFIDDDGLFDKKNMKQEDREHTEVLL